MEIIEVPGYAQEDKVPIAKRHLVPKQLKLHGLFNEEEKEEGVQFTDEALKMIGTAKKSIPVLLLLIYML